MTRDKWEKSAKLRVAVHLIVSDWSFVFVVESFLSEVSSHNTNKLGSYTKQLRIRRSWAANLIDEQ